MPDPASRESRVGRGQARDDEAGLETVEWAIILGLLVIGTIIAVLFLGNATNEAYQETHDALVEHGKGKAPGKGTNPPGQGGGTG